MWKLVPKWTSRLDQKSENTPWAPRSRRIEAFSAVLPELVAPSGHSLISVIGWSASCVLSPAHALTPILASNQDTHTSVARGLPYIQIKASCRFNNHNGSQRPVGGAEQLPFPRQRSDVGSHSRRTSGSLPSKGSARDGSLHTRPSRHDHAGAQGRPSP